MTDTESTPRETTSSGSDQSSSDANNGDARLIWIARLVPAAGFCLYLKYCRKRVELSTRILASTIKSLIVYVVLVLGALHQLGLFEPVYHTTSSGSTTTYDHPDNDISVVSQIVFRGTAQGEGTVWCNDGITYVDEDFEGSYERVLSEEEIKEAAMNDYIYIIGHGRETSCSIEIDGVEKAKDTNKDTPSYCSLKLDEPI